MLEPDGPLETLGNLPQICYPVEVYT
jgi:hypothetical protein